MSKPDYYYYADITLKNFIEEIHERKKDMSRGDFEKFMDKFFEQYTDINPFPETKEELTKIVDVGTKINVIESLKIILPDLMNPKKTISDIFAEKNLMYLQLLASSVGLEDEYRMSSHSSGKIKEKLMGGFVEDLSRGIHEMVLRVKDIYDIKDIYDTEDMSPELSAELLKLTEGFLELTEGFVKHFEENYKPRSLEAESVVKELAKTLLTSASNDPTSQILLSGTSRLKTIPGREKTD